MGGVEKSFVSAKLPADVNKSHKMVTEADSDKDDLKSQEKERFRQDTEHRHGLIIWMKRLISLWLSSVIVVLILEGIHAISLSDTVLVTLLATTTADVLGLPYIILRDLFKGK